MEFLLSSNEMKRCDSFTISEIGIPSMVLMERAALGTVEELCGGGFNLKNVLVVCGNGNNGGDGFAVARLLKLKNIPVTVLFAGEKIKCSVETKEQMKIALNSGVEILDETDFNGFTAIVDALFGIGLSRPVEGEFAGLIEQMNAADADILSIDVPSGISADTGEVMGVAVKAKRTVTFAYKKVGLILYPGAQYAGDIAVKGIGITAPSSADVLPKAYSYALDDLTRVPKRDPHTNKGSFGKVLAIAGSVNMSGAAYFSAKAAYRTGVGLVRIYTPEENRTILQTQLPEAILTTFKRVDIDFDVLREAISWADVIVIGPGIGTGADALAILTEVLEKASAPLVIDADALNLIALHPELLSGCRQEIIVTPHLGEMARLTHKNAREIAGQLIDTAQQYAAEYGVVCVLKDVRTVVADGNGSVYINQSGNSGMATGGSGDVLTGIIAGLIAQGMHGKEAAALGVYIHGLAGDCAAAKVGPYSLIADDIINGICEVLKKQY